VRYPFIKFQYARSSYNARVVKTLIAFKEGRYLVDILTGFGGGYYLYKDANALADLSDIPNFKKLPKGTKDPGGKWLGQRLRYWCMTYNTKQVKKADLPKRWDDLLTNTRWHNRKIGLGNRPQLCMLMLWGVKGKDWATDFMTRLINDVKPQLRKEGTNALISLNIAGEFDAAIPAAAYRTAQYVEKGAPIAWHCPEPIPLAVSGMGILRGTPHIHAAKLFSNWFLSKEGQIAQFAADQAPPVHKDLQTKEFLSFPDEILGKKIAFRGPEAELITKDLFKAWDVLWKQNAGEDKTKLITVSTTLDAVRQRGRTISFKHEGKTREVEVSGSRTKLTIGGKKESRSKLKAGMNCVIEAPENGKEATAVACK
jgi:ABC-type Fe3+ transport system substrate-binding protein